VITIEAVARLAEELPEVTVGTRWNNRTWLVGGHGFAWERPFSKADVKRFGDERVPDGPILAVRVADLNDKAALLATNAKGFFTIQHFDNYPAVLIELNRANRKPVREALIDGWLCCAPRSLVARYLETGRRS
jgi:hypothetical protein